MGGAAAATALSHALLSNTALTHLSCCSSEITEHGAAGIFLGALAGPDDAVGGSGQQTDFPPAAAAGTPQGSRRRCAVTKLELGLCKHLTAADAAALGWSRTRRPPNTTAPPSGSSYY